MENQKTIRCIVVGHNSGGEPDLLFVKVCCSESEYDEGKHYKAAIEYAESEGYEPGIIAFDENDPAGRAMLPLFAWNTASIIDIDGNVLPQEEIQPEPQPETKPALSLKDSFGGIWGGTSKASRFGLAVRNCQ